MSLHSNLASALFCPEIPRQNQLHHSLSLIVNGNLQKLATGSLQEYNSPELELPKPSPKVGSEGRWRQPTSPAGMFHQRQRSGGVPGAGGVLSGAWRFSSTDHVSFTKQIEEPHAFSSSSIIPLLFNFYALITLATSFLCPRSQGLADLVHLCHSFSGSF